MANATTTRELPEDRYRDSFERLSVGMALAMGQTLRMRWDEMEEPERDAFRAWLDAERELAKLDVA